MRKIWRIKPQDQSIQDRLSSGLNISKITAQLMANRGIATAEQAGEFLACSLSGCHNPFLMKDMERAVARIRKAISAGEKMRVYGDYDVDGMTSVAALSSALRTLGAVVDTYIPSRIEEGYGLNVGAVKKAAASGISLIITVDCGISSPVEVEVAKTLGVDIIITDHHEISGAVPAAYAVINPLQKDCHYPYKHLAGVGLAYKLIKALYDGTPHFAEDFLDLVSLGTVADIAPLTGENRIFAKLGLEEMNRRDRPGLKALITKSGLADKDLTCGHIGFALGPRINAMGRIGLPQQALELLLTEDLTRATALAGILDTENKNRRKIGAKIFDEAIEKVEREVNFKDHRVIVLAGENWHPGVIGIVASRLVERYYRPAILISLDGKIGKGSGRSIENFNLFEYIGRCRDLLAGFGGHEAACGVNIEKDRIDDFRERINEEAAKDSGDEVFNRNLDIDMDIPLGSLDEKVISEIEKLSPFGEENSRPVLASRNLRVKEGPRKIGRGGFKIWVTDGVVTCEAISFGRGGISVPETGSKIDLAYTPSMNEWQGVSSIQLELKDVVSV